ncbi:MAG: cobalamin biosynthesis protein CobD [Thiotrichales bacterium]|nr:cobalamin biosynthesis protein CobD [Thiotrichales bacterium]
MFHLSWSEWFALNGLIGLGAIILDRRFGEFLQQQHPVVWIGRLIRAYQEYFYRDSILAGGRLWFSVTFSALVVGGLLTFLFLLLPLWLAVPLMMGFASTLLAHRMLFDLVQAVGNSDQPAQAVAHLVSRDTEHLSDEDAYKAAMESYAENISDGVFAPLLYLLLFGLPGMLLYKAINTLDSMVGYRTPQYENWGKISAKIDDLANYVPARLTALLLLGLKKQTDWRLAYRLGRQHASPNAGHPISALALGCRCRLGGPTRYFGQWQTKAYFGRASDPIQIRPHHVDCALALRNGFDFTLLTLSLGWMLFWLQQGAFYG